MTTLEKLKILTDAAKYDVACTSSGVDRAGKAGALGSSAACGICHSFSADGRCISLLKVLFTNRCICDCQYCLNRRSNDMPRAAFTPRELADLTIAFYRRNYIEGLFLSSGILRNADYTCEMLLETLRILRREYHFRGYIHVKAIPGADEQLLARLGLLADRMSVNIEMPSEKSLQKLCPEKTRQSILHPMGWIAERIAQNTHELIDIRIAPAFVPAGQSTQMIVGATPESDFQILRLAQGLYQNYGLKRVFYSAYIPVSDSALLPPLGSKPPLQREHRLYQADWLMRFYGFQAQELLDEAHPTFTHSWIQNAAGRCGTRNFSPWSWNVQIRTRCCAFRGLVPNPCGQFCVRDGRGSLRLEALPKLGVVCKRAQYFITCSGRRPKDLVLTPEAMWSAPAAGAQKGSHSPAGTAVLGRFHATYVRRESCSRFFTVMMAALRDFFAVCLTATPAKSSQPRFAKNPRHSFPYSRSTAL